MKSSRLFELLAATPRRRILLLLREADSIRLPDALRTRGSSGARPDPIDASRGNHPDRESAADGENFDQLSVRLRHRDLPKLASENIVEWDRETWTVRRGPRFEEIEPVVDLLAENAHSFPDDLF